MSKGIDISGTSNRIYTKIDPNNNNIKHLVIQTGISSGYLELSSNLVLVNKDLSVYGELYLQGIPLETSFNSLYNQVQNLSGADIALDLTTITSDITNLNNIISNLDLSFTNLELFQDLSSKFYILENSFNNLNLDFLDEVSQNIYTLDLSVNTLQNQINNINISNNFLTYEELDNSLNDYVLEISLNNYVTYANLDNSLNAYVTYTNLDNSLNAYVTYTNLDNSLNAYVTYTNLDNSLNTYITYTNLDNSLNAYITYTNLDNSLNDYVTYTNLDNSLNDYVTYTNLDNSLNNYVTYTILDNSLNTYVTYTTLDNSLNTYVTYTTLDNSLNYYVLETSLNNYVTYTNLDNSLNNYVTYDQLETSLNLYALSGSFITREELDLSLANVNTNISGNFVTETSFNDLQNKSDNFFFFFKLKPWPPIYNNGSYSYPISNYGNSFSYNFGNFSNSYIDNFSNNSKNLQLFWKIPPRIFLDSTLNINNINYLPIYNNLIIQYKEQNNLYWSELLKIDNFPDPSNNSSYSDYNNKNDISMNFILNLTRDTSQGNNTNSIVISDNSFNINISGGFNNFQNSKAYQFRIFLNNISDLSNNFDKKNDQYDYQDISNNYLYFPDTSNVYFLTASRGDPKAPTNITFSDVDFYSVLISVELGSTTADTNNIISIPIPSDDNDNKLIFILDLLATKNSNYKKYIPYSINSYIIDDISNNNNPSTISNFTLTSLQTLEPEFTYNLSNYGMYFANDVSNISYASINQIFITPPPLRNEVNSDFNLYISNISLFNTNLLNYNSNLDFLNVKWRETNETKSFYFFNDSNSIFNINSNNLNYKLFNSLKTLNFNYKNNINEPRGIDLNNNNLCSFIMYSQKLKDSNESNIYTPFTIDSSFNNFLTTTVNNNNNKYTLNYNSQDIDPNGTSNTTYSKTNGYYSGLVLNDICYNIDLNDFFDITSDLCFNNIKLKTKITQEFNNASYNKEQEYLIYKITDDLSQNITLDSSSSSFDLIYDESNNGTYFGLTSIKPHNTKIDLVFSGLLNNLSKYIRPTNNTLATLNLKVNSSTTIQNNSNSNNINWQLNSNNQSQNINHSYSVYPLSNLNSTYGTYEGVHNNLTGFVDLTINDNVFAIDLSSNYLNLQLENGKIIDISNKYFWNIGTLANINNNNNNYFNDMSMIVFNNNPLDNIDHYSLGGTFYNPYSSNSYIKYNQALYQKQSSHTFYSGINNIFYKNYSIYKGNNKNTDYSLIDNSGDDINYTISTPYWFNNNTADHTINNRYKWICYDLDLSNITITTENVVLDLNVNKNYIGTNYLFYIKLKYKPGVQVKNQDISYSKWFDCLSVLNTGLSDIQRVTTNKSGVYNNNINSGTYPLQLILPYLLSATNLTLLIGLYDYDLNINDLDISFN